MPLLRIEHEPSTNSSKKFKRSIVCSCDTCHIEFRRKYQKSEADKLAIRSFCSRTCMYVACKAGGTVDEKKKLTYIENYGVDHPSKSPDVIAKIAEKNKKTCIERYGVENFGGTPHAREKSKRTMMERYGVDHAFNIDRKSSQERAKSTFLAKYGVEYPMQSLEIQEKRKQTCIKSYGVENFSQSESFKRKFETTMMEKYGVRNPLSIPAVRNKIAQTCMERYSVQFSSQAEISKISAKKTCMERYGVENQMQSDVIKNKVKNTCFSRYGTSCVLQNPAVRKKIRQNLGAGVSKKETEFFNKLTRIFEKVERHVYVAVGSAKREIDYYVHDIDCFVNYNGTYWHGKNKTDEELAASSSSQSEGIRRNKRHDDELVTWFNSKNQRFVVVWEDEEELGLHMLVLLRGLPTLDAWFASDPAIRKLKILGESTESAEDNT